MAALSAKEEELIANRMMLYFSSKRIKLAQEIPGTDRIMDLENKYNAAEHYLVTLMQGTMTGEKPDNIADVLAKMLKISKAMVDRDKKRDATQKAWSELANVDERIGELNEKYNQTVKRYTDAVEAVRQTGGQSGGVITEEIKAKILEEIAQEEN